MIKEYIYCHKTLVIKVAVVHTFKRALDSIPIADSLKLILRAFKNHYITTLVDRLHGI